MIPNRDAQFTFTSTSLLFFIFTFLAVSPAWSLEASSSTHDQRALAALENGDKQGADFWMARYLASPDSKSDIIASFLKKRRLEPAEFISDQYDAEFVEWFEKCTYPRWGGTLDAAKEKVRTFEIASSQSEGYFATITGSPALENWWIAGEKPKSLLLAMVSAKDKPLIYAGKRLSAGTAIYFPPVPMVMNKRALHYVWKPEFFDLDGDGLPEVWIRYNVSQKDGFAQVLEIYKIQNNEELVFLKRFKGESEGAVRRLPDGTVEVLTGVASKAGLTHRLFDRHRVEVFEFYHGEFRRVSQKKLPHILKGAEWKKYFLLS